MNTLYNKVSKEFLCPSKLEEHKFVQNFENKSKTDPEYKKSLIEAYIVRDLYFGSNRSIKELFEGHCNKLMLNPTDAQKIQKRKYEFMQSIRNMMDNSNFESVSIETHYNNCINRESTSKEIDNLSKYQSIMVMIDNNEDIEDIYNEFSLEDLFYIGW